MKKLSIVLILFTVFSIARLNSENTSKELTNPYKIFSMYKSVTHIDSLKDINGFHAKFTSNMANLKTQLQLYYLRPEKMKLGFRVRNATITIIYDGEKGWTKNSIMGVIPIQPMELDMLHKFTEIINTPFLNVDTATWKMELKNDSNYTVDGRPAYKITFTNPEGITTDGYFSKENYKLIKAQYVTTNPEQPVQIQIYYQEYKEFDNGLILPTRVDYITAGVLEQLTIDSLESGLRLNHRDFLKPF